MVNISTRTWGLIITMTPPVGKTDLARYFDELRMTHLQESKGFFGVLFDLSALGPLHPDARDNIVSSLKLLLQRGMVRSAYGLNHNLLLSQVRRLAGSAETLDGARFLDASSSDWKRQAEAWAAQGMEPQNLFDNPNSSLVP